MFYLFLPALVLWMGESSALENPDTFSIPFTEATPRRGVVYGPTRMEIPPNCLFENLIPAQACSGLGESMVGFMRSSLLVDIVDSAKRIIHRGFSNHLYNLSTVGSTVRDVLQFCEGVSRDSEELDIKTNLHILLTLLANMTFKEQRIFVIFDGQQSMIPLQDFRKIHERVCNLMCFWLNKWVTQQIQHPTTYKDSKWYTLGVSGGAGLVLGVLGSWAVWRLFLSPKKAGPGVVTGLEPMVKNVPIEGTTPLVYACFALWIGLGFS